MSADSTALEPSGGKKPSPSGTSRGGRVLLGITGGIAAYRSLEIARLVVRSGGEVRVVLTSHALEFVTRLSVETLSGNPAYCEMFGGRSEPSMAHIELSTWPDVVVVAPATANIIGKMAAGICDDLLTTTLMALSPHIPIVLAPAMNTRMWNHPALARNLEILARDLGPRLTVVSPQQKLLACGEWGMGAMAEPETIWKAATTTHPDPASPRRRRASR